MTPPTEKKEKHERNTHINSSMQCRNSNISSDLCEESHVPCPSITSPSTGLQPPVLGTGRAVDEPRLLHFCFNSSSLMGKIADFFINQNMTDADKRALNLCGSTRGWDADAAAEKYPPVLI